VFVLVRIMGMIVSVVMIVRMAVGVIVPAIRAMHMTVIVVVSMRACLLMSMVMVMRVIMAVVVAAVRSVHMPMIASMVVCVVMTLMLAVLVYTAGVALLVVVVAMAAAIRAGLRLKGRADRLRRRAQPFEHVLEHMVGRDAQESLADLHRHMPVAKVISGAREILGRLAGDMQNLLGLRDHFHYATVARDHQVAAAQDFSARQHQADFFAGVQFRSQAALLA